MEARKIGSYDLATHLVVQFDVCYTYITQICTLEKLSYGVTVM